MNSTENNNRNWWKRRTSLEKKIILISIFAIIIIIVLIITLALISNHKKCDDISNENAHNNICLNRECVHTASNVMLKMDQNIEPCNNFYQFACGGFLKNTIIPDDKTAVSIVTKLNDVLQEQLRILISEEPNKHETKPLKLAKELYKVCMNKTRIQERGITHILSLIKNLGGWPVLDGNKWNENLWSWEETIKKFRKSGFSVNNLIDFTVDTDAKNSSRHIIYINELSPSLEREYMTKGLNNRLVKSYYNYMVDVAVIYGANRTDAEKELKESLQFQIDLANISIPKVDFRNSSILYNAITLREMQNRYPYVHWIDYINGLLPNNITVDENEIIILTVPRYFDELGKLLKKTAKRNIANYMMWRAISYSSLFSTDVLRKRSLEYDKILYGKQEQEPRWKECIVITKGELSISVGALYVRKHFNEDAKREMVIMVDTIRAELGQILNKVKWMDETTRQAAQKKLSAILTHIGYPDELMDNNKIEEYYKNLEIIPDSYLESVLNIRKFEQDYQLSKLRKPVNKTDWIRYSQTAVINAGYVPTDNSIDFPAGILQGDFFSADRPKYMNYGAIGSIVGHEITHGFDDQGRQYDDNGNLVDWWKNDTAEAYIEKAYCIIQQYDTYIETMTGLHLDGINTQGENIADNGGVKEAYNAYKKWAQENGPEPKLPGLDYTPEQMFWISFAQLYCKVYRLETLKNVIETNNHSPGQFRVLGSLKNMIDFSKDFNCADKTPMNPTKKCEVW